MSNVFDAITAGDNLLLEEELKRNPRAVLDQTQWGVTPLIMAVKSGNSGAVSLLLQANADVNQSVSIKSRTSGRVHSGATALMFCGSTDIADQLLSSGANPGLMDSKGWSAFLHIVRTLNRGLVECVLSSGYVPRQEEHSKYLFFINDEISFRKSTPGADGERLGSLVEYLDWYRERFGL